MVVAPNVLSNCGKLSKLKIIVQLERFGKPLRKMQNDVARKINFNSIGDVAG